MHFSASYRLVWKERIVYSLIFSRCMAIASQCRNLYTINATEQNKMTEQLNSETVINEEKPPVLGSWKNIYFAVIINAALLIILFYFFSEAFK